MKEKLSSEMTTGKGGTTWLSDEGVQVFMASVDVPEAVPKYHEAFAIKPASNPRYIFAKLLPNGPKVPVLVVRKIQRRLKGKRILVEEIKSTTGSSYRYVKARE